MDEETKKLNEETRLAWNANAGFWNERMGDGNEFFRLLQWPAILRLLDPKPGQKVLDIATGNGLTAKRLGELGADVTAFDFSEDLIALAKERTPANLAVQYKVIDAVDKEALRGLGKHAFDAALCNMALFDMAEIRPLFRILPELIKPEGCFVFSLLHPSFNNTSSVHVVEERDEDGVIKTAYSVKISRYMTASQARGLAMRGQPQAQWYFDRPLQTYLALGFENGFVLDGFEERAFEPDVAQKTPLGWGGQYSEIPPVIVARMRLSNRS